MNESHKNNEFLGISEQFEGKTKEILNPNKIKHTSPYTKEVYKVEKDKVSQISAKVSEDLASKIGELMKSARAKREGGATAEGGGTINLSLSLKSKMASAQNIVDSSKIASAKNIVDSDSQSLEKNKSIKQPSVEN